MSNRDLEELRQQVVELQSQLAFHEDTVNALNDALSQQQREIITLRRQLTLLKQRQDEQALLVGEGSPSPEPKPPHY